MTTSSAFVAAAGVLFFFASLIAMGEEPVRGPIILAYFALGIANLAFANL